MSSSFPRTQVGGLSVPRLIIGTNWFLGWSHSSKAKSQFIKTTMSDRSRIADVLEVFFRSGAEAVMGLLSTPLMVDAIKDAEDRTGVKAIRISTPLLPVTPDTAARGFDAKEVAKVLDEQAACGVDICMPHQVTTDAMVDRLTRKIRHMDSACRMIRDRGMVPGLSTHMPETIVYADESGLDVESYISIYNSAGFLMQVEVDWTNRVIHGAAKPVMTIKPMAAGRIAPFEALSFVWNTLRPQDMVTVGTLCPEEAAECVELSLSILERRSAKLDLQETRSKGSIKRNG